MILVSRQLGLFQQYISRPQGIVGEEEAFKIISNALILISAGTNDFALNSKMGFRKERGTPSVCCTRF